MYRCQNCNKLVEFADKKEQIKCKKLRIKPRHLTSALTVVTKTREKTYKNKIRKGKKVITTTSQGWEIKEELKVCRDCNKLLGGVDDYIS